ncbi:MAG TPA: PadR family transcriptional regulator, partial [Ilumatobacter sp.]
MHYMHEDFEDHRRGPHGHGRHRARRGALTMAIVALLDERPMHGYELITVLEERSGGRWKPSPGAIYPALGKLEARGVITSTEQDGRRQYELTDTGRKFAAELSKHDKSAPWEQLDLGAHGDLRRTLAELVGPARQIGRFGTPAQTEAATKVL